ncbi:DNA polymerase III subunit delta [Aneurinibacillus terranovensis]|uniref:DNA polymerase III subunit delta n=1 Tax=Aneurinibacillus terranovensis TaxID=278991 RepID=UPI0003F792DE|nr:DNA polymerase III subunit delta [Aneurinibacillus terranovensis]
MDVRQLAREIKQGKVAPVYLFYGKEQYLMDEVITMIQQQVIDEASRDFNYSVYDLRETAVQAALQDAETFPFMGEKRLVRATQALFLTGGKVKESSEHNLDSLLNYLNNPPDYTTFILEVPEEKLDERKKTVKALLKNSVVVPFMPLKDDELVHWISRRAAKHNASVMPEAARMLITMTGGDLRRLNQEIEKMATYVGEGETITPEVVGLLGSRQLEQDVFRLVDQVARLQLENAMRIYYDLQMNKEEPLKILTLLARQFRILLQIKILQPKGYSPQQMASMLGVHPYVAKLAAEQSRLFSELALKRIIQKLAEEDYRIKTGQIDKTLALELIIMGMKEMVSV